MSQTTLDIKEPGLNVLPPGVERHTVNAGGLTGLQIFPDDEIEIINDEGNQICEIICFDKDGKSELGILNQKENSKKSFIKEILEKKNESSLVTNFQLKKRNLDINNSKSVILFDSQQGENGFMMPKTPKFSACGGQYSYFYDLFVCFEKNRRPLGRRKFWGTFFRVCQKT